MKNCILIKISLQIVPTGPSYHMAALASKMSWRRIDHKQKFEPMLTRFIEAYMRH